MSKILIRMWRPEAKLYPPLYMVVFKSDDGTETSHRGPIDRAAAIRAALRLKRRGGGYTTVLIEDENREVV